MKIGICTPDKEQHTGSHCSNHYPELFRQIFSELGHTAYFLGPNIPNDPMRSRLSELDMVFFWGLESHVFYPDYAKSLLAEFPGPKVLYITTERRESFYSQFSHIVGTDIPSYANFYHKHYPNVKFRLLPFASPMYSWIDTESKVNPYLQFTEHEQPKIVYTGLINTQQMQIINAIAESGHKIYVGGKYLEGGKPSRGFYANEVAQLHKNIKLIAPCGRFVYGEHWKWLTHADLAINVYPCRASNSISSKMVDYLVCGLPVVSENSSPNNFHLKQFNAGLSCQWNDADDMIAKIKEALSIKWDKDKIKQLARAHFNPISVGKEIIKLCAER